MFWETYTDFEGGGKIWQEYPSSRREGGYCTEDLDTMHQLHHKTMPKVLLHEAGHCEHKITLILKFHKF